MENFATVQQARWTGHQKFEKAKQESSHEVVVEVYFRRSVSKGKMIQAKYETEGSWKTKEFSGLKEGEDTLRWNCQSKGYFTVSSAYRDMNQLENQIRFLPWKLIWKVKIPHKVIVFSWLVVKEAVLTQQNLMKRRFQLSPRGISWSVPEGTEQALVSSSKLEHGRQWVVVIKADGELSQLLSGGPYGRGGIVLTPNVPDIMVVPPEDDHLRHVIDTMALYVLDGGCAFEQAIMERGRGNPLFGFLFELGSKEHTYYVWRLYSFAQVWMLEITRAAETEYLNLHYETM
ncbi:hypothetical protein FXO38_36788 [Capsicum annuum]|nr:hypothetical protein FXO38_36788 [Capsicum annuum]